MSIRHFERLLPRASRAASTALCGAGLRMRAGTPAWQVAGNGMNDGSRRVPGLGSAMR